MLENQTNIECIYRAATKLNIKQGFKGLLSNTINTSATASMMLLLGILNHLLDGLPSFSTLLNKPNKDSEILTAPDDAPLNIEHSYPVHMSIYAPS